MTYEENVEICKKFHPEINYESLRDFVATINAVMTKVCEPDDLEAQNDEARVHEIAYTVVNRMSPKEIDYPAVFTELEAIHDKYKNRPNNKEWARLAEEREELIVKGLL